MRFLRISPEELNVDSFLIGYNGAFAIYKNEVLVNEPMDRRSGSEDY